MPKENALRLTPKQGFLNDPHAASVHSDLMASPAFKSAASVALLQYQFNLLPGGSEPTALAAAALRLSGAKAFLDTLMNLGIEEALPGRVLDNGLESPEEFWTRSQPPV